MKKRSLINLLMSRFSFFMAIILLLSTPIFYLIITNYYAEDLISVVKIAHIPESQLDLEKDTVIGLLLQILSIVLILGISVFMIMRFIPVRLWSPFYETLHKINHFKVEDEKLPVFSDSEVKEFAELNATLSRILSQSVRSYQVQKQFTENASHELQTPLAIVQGKLDLLFQNQDLTKEQVTLIQDIYHEISQMSRLNRNLLLLAKIENAQYKLTNHVNIAGKLETLLPVLGLLSNGIKITTNFDNSQLTIDCNEVLLESMINNLIVNAVRHNQQDGEIIISIKENTLTIANASDEIPLDTSYLFERFYRSSIRQKGNGLGLAIVKSICDYHHWTITYFHEHGLHNFSVHFK